MKSFLKFRVLVVLLALFLVAGPADLMGQTKKKPTIRRTTTKKTTAKPAVKLYRVDAGSRFRVRMNETISSKSARIGDRFTTTVTEPVYSSTGVVVIPVGSIVTGRVDVVKPAAKGGKPGEISATFIEVKLPNGSKRAINGSLTELTSDDAKSDNEGTASGDKMKNRKLIFIGGGGAGGAVLGAAIGGGKGAVIGGILGAAGGLIGERMTKGEEAEVKSGTEFGVYLNQAISLPKFVEVDNP